MYETNEKTKHLLKQKINEVINKGDISPSEMDCIYKAYEVIGKIYEIEAMDEYGEMYESYGDSYASNRGGSSRRRSMARSYESSYGEEDSMRRGRGADGRFVSRARGGRSMDGSYERSYEDGYSNHSVHDRMIASLEREMDMAKSDYERQQIQEEIRSLRERQK